MCKLSALMVYMNRGNIEFREYSGGNGSYFRDGFSVPVVRVVFSDYENNGLEMARPFEMHLKRCRGLFYKVNRCGGDISIDILTASDYSKSVKHAEEVQSCVDYFAMLRHKYSTETACRWFETYINPESVAV